MQKQIMKTKKYNVSASKGMGKTLGVRTNVSLNRWVNQAGKNKKHPQREKIRNNT